MSQSLQYSSKHVPSCLWFHVPTGPRTSSASAWPWNPGAAQNKWYKHALSKLQTGYAHVYIIICESSYVSYVHESLLDMQMQVKKRQMFLKLRISILYLIWISQKNIKSLSHRYWLLIYVCKMLLESLPGCNRSTLMVGGIRLIQWLCLRWWHHHQDGWLYALQEYWYQSVTPGWDHHETSWNHWFVLPIKN